MDQRQNVKYLQPEPRFQRSFIRRQVGTFQKQGAHAGCAAQTIDNAQNVILGTGPVEMRKVMRDHLAKMRARRQTFNPARKTVKHRRESRRGQHRRVECPG